jgi:hypothetical protein
MKAKSSPYRGAKGSVLPNPTWAALRKLVQELQKWTEDDWDRAYAGIEKREAGA